MSASLPVRPTRRDVAWLTAHTRTLRPCGQGGQGISLGGAPPMSLLEAIVLGLVQGFTEFLPISSTAHLRIAPELFGWPDPGAAYSAVIQLGTVAAVLIYFRRDIVSLG